MLIATTCDDRRPLALSAYAASVDRVDRLAMCPNIFFACQTRLSKTKKPLSAKFGERLIFMWRFIETNAAAMGTLNDCAAHLHHRW
jgi:hypothetical protein